MGLGEGRGERGSLPGYVDSKGSGCVDSGLKGRGNEVASDDRKKGKTDGGRRTIEWSGSSGEAKREDKQPSRPQRLSDPNGCLCEVMHILPALKLSASECLACVESAANTAPRAACFIMPSPSHCRVTEGTLSPALANDFHGMCLERERPSSCLTACLGEAGLADDGDEEKAKEGENRELRSEEKGEQETRRRRRKRKRSHCRIN
ncbi:hypothetical protein E2C01_081957 [Portunus trituberculatus]|uniref:Uncharacterized protein n=1 Tax=Portunus trituberculatus TaxID=210409 RepID=A0A5B7IZI0_PORTR|nr:hypothetical protein [Portunus trituberculatus]